MAGPPMPGSSPRRAATRSSRRRRIVRDLHALNGRWPGVTVNVGRIIGRHAAQRRRRAVRPRGRRPGDDRATDSPAAEAAIRELVATTEVPDTTVDADVMVAWLPMEKLERSGRLVEHATGRRRAARLRGQRHGDRRRVRCEHDVRHGRADARRPGPGRRQRPLARGVPRRRLDRAADGDARRAAAGHRARPGCARLARPTTRGSRIAGG